MQCVSIMIPKKESEVVGPSIFSEATGIPRSEHKIYMNEGVLVLLADGQLWWAYK